MFNKRLLYLFFSLAVLGISSAWADRPWNSGINYSAERDAYLVTSPLLFEPPVASLIPNSDLSTSTDWTVGAGWTIAGGTATHTPGSVEKLTTTIPGVLIDHIYVLTVNVVSQSAGTAFVNLGVNCLSDCSFPFVPGLNTYLAFACCDSGTVAIEIQPDTNSDIVIDSIQVELWGDGSPKNSNIAIGIYSLFSNTGGYANTAMGVYTLFFNTGGYFNTALGTNALYSNTTGHENTATGFRALYSNTTGNYNIAAGLNTLYSNTTGVNLAAIGTNALHENTTGISNTALGTNALYTNTTGSSGIGLGYYAGYYQTDATNLLIVDNRDRGTEANELIESLIVGHMDAVTANQTLDFHAAIASYITVVASLPTCNSGMKGRFMTVTDATAPTYGATLSGGGAVTAFALCDGSNWTAH